MLELVNRLENIKTGFNIIDEKGNIENIDWKSIKLWKRDLTDNNSWKQNDVYEEVDCRNQKLISTRCVLREKMKDRKNYYQSKTCTWFSRGEK